MKALPKRLWYIFQRVERSACSTRRPLLNRDTWIVLSKLRLTVERLTLADQVYTSLKKAIVEGDLKPGERLKETEIALSLGASRTPVREALSRLQQEGLVRKMRSGGLTVVQLSEDDVREIFGLIMSLESHAARLAAERVTAEQVEHLRSICDRADALVKSGADGLNEVNYQFHHALIEATGQRRLGEMLRNLRTAMQPYRAVTLATPRFRAQSVKDHRAMVDRLARGDAEGLAALVVEHLQTAQEVTIDALSDQRWRLKPEE
jgi:DNA-binding GntR family transcriptional regulator